jgi:hypothetical protein
MLLKEKEIKIGYFLWLCNIIEVHKDFHNIDFKANPSTWSPPSKSYRLLIKDLHRKKFVWSIPNDDNRAFEAKNLREVFCESENIPFLSEILNDNNIFDEEASMLELIMSLAIRCESMLVDRSDNVSVNVWFWRMLSNVGLDEFTSDKYHNSNAREIVDQILDKIIYRTYDRSGKGGLFPLKRPKKDQRKVELWYQMCSYLVENYYV